MRHPTIDPLRNALRDLLCASEDYVAALARPEVRIAVISDPQTRADLQAKGEELAAAHLLARNVMADVLAAMLEDDRETQPLLPGDDDDATDDATDDARDANASLSDVEIRERAARAAARLFGGKDR